MTFHCLFEQSGTFKNIFKKYGYDAFDYDIKNDFKETDYVVDLFAEINNAYNNLSSIFDTMSSEDYILAFFPCIRFEGLIKLNFRGEAGSQRTWGLEKKLEYTKKWFSEMNDMYQLISNLAIVCLRKNLKLIIENPWQGDHTLITYWCIRPQFIDLDRRAHGDKFKKPTAYWFINCEPKCEFILDQSSYSDSFSYIRDHGLSQVEKSMINPEYAEWFIRTFILCGEKRAEVSDLF